MATQYKLLLSLLLYCGYFAGTQAQSVAASYTLNTNESGDEKSYVARDSIVLKPGFQFSATSDYNFNAKIDRGLLFPPTEDTYLRPSGTPTYDPTEGVIVGSTPGQFEVSSTGAATYSIPIEVPAGVGGMQPSISIAYNSQSGNGLVGFGTNLSGFSVITRAPKDIYHDGTAAAMTHSADEAYYLDGQRLIYDSGTAGQEGAVYYLESDPFSKIIVHGTYNTSTANTWFEVQSSTGMVSYYGKTSDAKQSYTCNGSPRINAWYICYIKDPLGNYMNYTYNSYNYFICPNAITYGQNNNETNSLQNTVAFEYESRSNDPQTFVLEGTVKGSLNYRLKTITSKTGSETFRTYNLVYNTTSDNSGTKYSRLTSVTEKNGSGEALNPVKLNWSYLPAFNPSDSVLNIDTTAIYPVVFLGRQQYITADLNNDGLTDIISLVPGKEKSSTSNTWNYYTFANVYQGALTDDGSGRIHYVRTSRYKYSISIDDDDWTVRNEAPSVLDFNGDGINDLLVPSVQLINDSYNNCKNAWFMFVGGTLDNTSILYSLKYSNEMPAYATGDINNNGKGDIIFIEKGANAGKYPCKIVESNQGSASMDLTFSSKPKDLFVSDFNADGLNDLMVFYDGGYSIFWNQGNGISASTFSDNKKTAGTNIGDVKMIRQGDFNGDGLPDFLLNDSLSNIWNFALNNGDGTFEKKAACILGLYDQTTTKDDDKFQCLVYDFDMDGKSDVVINKTMYLSTNQTFTYWMRSTGTTLTKVNSACSDRVSDGYASRYLLGDFNGDGQTELLNLGYDCYGSMNANVDPSWRLYKTPEFSANSGKITSIVDGFGGTTSISYASLANGGIYTEDANTTNTYPIADYTLPIHAVKNVTNDNGAAGSISISYQYQGLEAHLQGKGLLGMKLQTAKNNTLNITTRTEQTWNTTFFIPIQTCIKTYVGNTLDKRTTILNWIEDKGNKKYFTFPYTKKDEDIKYEYMDSVITTHWYDPDYGYLETEYIRYNNDNRKMSRVTHYVDQVLVGGSYHPQTIVSYQFHSDDNDYFYKRTHITYDSITGLKKQVINNYASSLPVTTDYTYDSFGNQLTSISSGSGITSVTKITEYDDTHRFPTKQYTTPASAVNTFTYDTWGNVLAESDETNAGFVLTTTHSYDNWGFRTQAVSPLGLKTAYTKGWGTAADKRYYSWEQTAGEPWSKTWYDNKGREVAAESIGAKNLSIQTSTSYNAWGKVSEKQSQTGDLTITENFTYDTRGRLSTQSNSTGQSSTITYGLRKITTVTNGRTYIKTYDEWGNLKTSIDPVDTVSYKYASSGKPQSVTSANATFSMTYDDVGNQKTLTDPNAGTTTYTYDAAGRITKQVDGRGKIAQNIYDGLGRLSTATVDGATTTYTYGTSGNEALRFVKQETAGNYTGYTYDGYGRVTTETQQVNGASALNFGYSYNSLGQVIQISYPGSLTASYTYDSYGNKVKTQVGSQPIWKLTGLTGTVTTSKLGGTLTSTETHDANGFLSNLKVENSSQVLHNMSFVFDEPTGNLTSRSGMLSQTETFAYDNLDRLTDVTVGSTNTMHLGYAANGNISTKTGIGNYSYGDRPHAVTGVDNTDGLISRSEQATAFNGFGKIQSISENGYQLDFTYGPDQERWKTVLKKDGNTVKTTIFAGGYEQTTVGGATQRLYYLDGGAIYVKQDGQSDKVYYACTDHLGSITKLVDGNGNGAEVFTATYDAWGKRTVTDSTFAYYRGYTGHEHLPEFGLINMNGRLYDPALGRFLSCDPFVQMPDFSQNFNRYSYCLNNPLKYNDPSGELFYIFPYIGWSPNGGFNVGISAGIGLPGAASVGVNVEYNTGNHSWSFTTNASLAGAYLYGGYNTKAGFMAGAGFNMYSFNPGGFGFSSNLTSVGIDYSQHGGLSMSMMGVQMSEGGVSFDPSVSGGYTFQSGRYGTEDFSDNDPDWDDDSYGSALKYSTENAMKFIRYNKELQADGLLDVYADGSMPSGYKKVGDMVYSENGDKVAATTHYRGKKYFLWGKQQSDVYLYKSAFKNPIKLYLSIGHEFVHVNTHYKYGIVGERESEATAYYWTIRQAQKWGVSVKFFKSQLNFYNEGIDRIYYSVKSPSIRLGRPQLIP